MSGRWLQACICATVRTYNLSVHASKNLWQSSVSLLVGPRPGPNHSSQIQSNDITMYTRKFGGSPYNYVYCIREGPGGEHGPIT